MGNTYRVCHSNRVYLYFSPDVAQLPCDGVTTLAVMRLFIVRNAITRFSVHETEYSYTPMLNTVFVFQSEIILISGNREEA